MSDLEERLTEEAKAGNQYVGYLVRETFYTREGENEVYSPYVATIEEYRERWRTRDPWGNREFVYVFSPDREEAWGVVERVSRWNESGGKEPIGLTRPNE